MTLLFYVGWVLLIVAFGAAAAETLARGLPVETAVLLSAKELWHSLAPGHFVVTRIHVERVAPWLWDPVILTLLWPPAWAVFGVPGALLAWYCRPNRHMTEEEREDLEKQRQTLFLFDELADDAHRQAREDDEPRGQDDRVPTHDGHDALEEAERMPGQIDDEFLRQFELDLRREGDAAENDRPRVIAIGADLPDLPRGRIDTQAANDDDAAGTPTNGANDTDDVPKKE